MLIGDVWITRPMIAEISELTGVDRTTVARWIKRRQLPPTVYRYLRMVLNGRLADIHDAWAGWSIDVRSGDLISPVGTMIKPGEVMSIPYRLHQIAALNKKTKSQDIALQSADNSPQRQLPDPKQTFDTDYWTVNF